MREEKTGPGSAQATIREHIIIREHVTLELAILLGVTFRFC